MDSFDDKEVSYFNGFIILGILIPILIASYVYSFDIIGSLFFLVFATGFSVIQPNSGRAYTFFGKYVGTLSKSGFYWTNIFYIGRKVSTRLVNFETKLLKVNDADGNPLEVTGIVVYHITSIARSVFVVDSVHEFVRNQSEAALRHLIAKYPYTGTEESLMNSREKVSKEFTVELQNVLSKAGITIDESHLNHLAYAPEIASEMLRVQQANAVVMAREKLVKGAVETVHEAIVALDKKGIKIEQKDQASMVINLMTVLVSDSGVSPVIPVQSSK
ncbi:SPFH domain-containing protein [Mariprofundus sp. KV]|uniref:SPFH domain-containing protein n=1 Tax=Mariprofundus sp. KV TaxID=2608715 RepID=UPI0015A0DD86|nr:SPFH domain-containing protein [Mariprofundus sp. KV]NWF35135.1 SPFH domain-containing protein [Mariprofundus sp. KV]